MLVMMGSFQHGCNAHTGGTQTHEQKNGITYNENNEDLNSENFICALSRPQKHSAQQLSKMYLM